MEIKFHFKGSHQVKKGYPTNFLKYIKTGWVYPL